jgi:urea carboxylase
VRDPVFREGADHALSLAAFHYRPATVDVLEPGVQTSVQDWPGRTGYWDVGVPPSGADGRAAFRLANRLVGNAKARPRWNHAGRPHAALQRRRGDRADRRRMGADARRRAVPTVAGVRESRRQRAELGAPSRGRRRAYLAVGGGFDVPDYLGSKPPSRSASSAATPAAPAHGDVLHLAAAPRRTPATRADTHPAMTPPAYTHHWDVGVLYGPHGAPDFFTAATSPPSSPPTGRCTTTPAAPACA